MKEYIQTRTVSWLNTTKGTVWVSTGGTYIQPKELELRDTLLGVDLYLLDEEDETLFEPIQ